MACAKYLAKELNILGRNAQKIVTTASPIIQKRNAASDRENKLEKKTHTGQVFDTDDYRNARFVNATRYVNENWGIKLIDEVPPKECTERVVYCDGGNGPLGHPKVYINLDKPGCHICGYCGLRFVKKDEHH